MRASVLLLALLTCAACVPPALTSTDGGSVSSDSGVDAGPVGSYCFLDPSSGLAFCGQTSQCPGLTVDPDLFPNCGFRMAQELLDLECVCSTAICPVGIASTCAQAAQLLKQQSELTVCAQEAEGRCVSIGKREASTCDRNCAAGCWGDTSCRAACGC